MKMNLQVKGIKQEKSTEVANLFLNKQDYSTSAIYERVKENGKEFVRGYFYSAKKANFNSLPSKESSENTREICTVNNQIDSNEDISNYIISNSFNKKFNLTQIFKIFIILIFVLFSFLDLISYFRHINDENLILKYQCEKEFMDNECHRITIEDGPIINNFCREKEICMNIQYSNVYFHSVIIKYFKEIANSLTPTSLYSKILTTCGIILGLIIIRIF